MSSGVPGTTTERVIDGHSRVAAMRTAAGLRAAAEQIADLADELGCRALYPASETAEAAVAVAVALSNDAIRTVTLGAIARGEANKVVLVEAVAVSGMKVRLAAEAVRRAGASWVGAAILEDLGDPRADDVGSNGGRFGLIDELRTTR